MAAFADADDMVARYDARTLGQLCSDSNVPVGEVDLSSDTKMTMALNTATGNVKASLFKGDRYTSTDLTNLTGESLEYLKDLTCCIAFWYLWRRKKYVGDKDPQREQVREEANAAMEMLRNGEVVLDVAANIDAGKPQIDTIPRATIVTTWHLVRDRATGRFFPQRRSYNNR